LVNNKTLGTEGDSAKNVEILVLVTSITFLEYNYLAALFYMSLIVYFPSKSIAG